MAEATFASDLRDGAEEIPGPPSHWMTPAEVLRTRTAIGERLSTGIPALDRLTGGGLLPGTLVILLGRPGSGKTTFALQVASGMAGPAVVGALLVDEGLVPGVRRMAQAAGFDRAALEAAEESTVEAAARALEPVPIHLLDPDSPEATFETFVAGMAERAGVRPQVWVLDSAQVIRVARREKDSSLRERVKELLERIASEARRRRAVALLVSQTNRAAYRSKKAAENSDPLSAGAESSSIEFMGDVACFFSGDVDEAVEVLLVKNRLGRPMVSFRLEFDRERAVFREVDGQDSAAAREGEAARRKRERIAKVKARILEVLRKEPDGLPTASLVDRAGARRADVVEARTELEREGAIFGEESSEKGGTRWRKATRPGSPEREK